MTPTSNELCLFRVFVWGAGGGNLGLRVLAGWLVTAVHA